MSLRIAGFQGQTLIDYPGNISSVVFTQGCNFRCGYCHNPNLVLPDCFEPCIPEASVLHYLEQKKHLLDAVCITGGEPCVQSDLPVFINKVKSLGLKVKLDTNGTYPILLEGLIKDGLIDFVAMDIKHQLNVDAYNLCTGGCVTEEVLARICSSINCIKGSGVAHEFRTTIIKGIHEAKHLKEIAELVEGRYKLQNFNSSICIQNNESYQSFSPQEFENMSNICNL